MTPYLQDPDVTVYVGDSLAVLGEMLAESIDCCVTSPPYWGLRDYGEDAQIGLESSPQDYVEKLVGLFREVRRVLTPHGTVWLNLGDSYATQSGKGSNVPQTKHPNISYPEAAAHRSRSFEGIKPKDLVGIPWMVAFALRDDGWYLRSDVIWQKPNTMPESVTDRPTKSHEYIFLLTKSPSYFYDKDAVLEPYESTASAGNSQRKYGNDVGVPGGREGDLGRGIPWRVSPAPLQAETLGDLPPEAPRGADGRRKTGVKASDGSIQHRDGERWPGAGRNMRSVWSIVTQPYSGAHFAVFPEELARRCILAGCPEQVCRTCGEPRKRIMERPEAPEEVRRLYERKSDFHTRAKGLGGQTHQDWLAANPKEVVGYTDCGHDNFRPGLVLDPFLGSGTTALVARKHGRHAIGIELNQKYVDDHIAVRLAQQSLFSGEGFGEIPMEPLSS